MTEAFEYVTAVVIDYSSRASMPMCGHGGMTIACQPIHISALETL